MARKYTKNKLQEAVKVSNSFADVARYFGVTPHGGAQGHIKTIIKKFGIDYSHFKGKAWNKGMSFPNQRKSAKDIFKARPKGSNREHSHLLRRALLEVNIPEICSECGLGSEWNEKELKLEIDHKDGDYLNNLQDNLRFICPNCHTQTKNYKNKNRRKI